MLRKLQAGDNKGLRIEHTLGILCPQFRHIVLKIKQIHVSNLIVQPPFARNQPECLRHGEGQHISYQQRHKTIPLSFSSSTII